MKIETERRILRNQLKKLKLKLLKFSDNRIAHITNGHLEVEFYIRSDIDTKKEFKNVCLFFSKLAMLQLNKRETKNSTYYISDIGFITDSDREMVIDRAIKKLIKYVNFNK